MCDSHILDASHTSIKIIGLVCDSHILDASQFRFRKRRGCQEAIALECEFINKIQGSRKIIIVVKADVSKTFNKVWYDGLSEI